LFLVRCVLEFRCGWVEVVSVLQAEAACNTDTTSTQPHRNSNTHRTKNNTTNVIIQQNGRKLLMMDILMSETRWAHKKWNKITSDIELVFYSSKEPLFKLKSALQFNKQNISTLPTKKSSNHISFFSLALFLGASPHKWDLQCYMSHQIHQRRLVAVERQGNFVSSLFCIRNFAFVTLQQYMYFVNVFNITDSIICFIWLKCIVIGLLTFWALKNMICFRALK